MRYRREIDGLRAIAVVSVMLFHAGINVFSGGYVGVDVFFVISGYLITSIIITEKEAGTFSLVRFYERRVRRILPALLFMILLTMLAAAVVLAPFSGRAFYRSVAATSLFSSNILFFLESRDYFDVSADLKPLLHTWSLGVEEQYYVLFPLVMLAFWTRARRYIPLVIVVLAVASFIASQWTLQKNPAASFFLLHTRGWELAVGALVALLRSKEKVGWCKHRRAWVCRWGSAAGLFLVILAIFSFDRQTPFPGLYALVPVVGVAMVIAFAEPNTIATKILGGRVLVGIGLMSYSLYLWHQPIYAIARHLTLTELSTIQSLQAIFATVILGYLSYRYVERPFRTDGRISRNAVVGLTAVCSVSFAAVGVAGHFSVGFQDLKLAAIPEQRQHIFIDHFDQLREKGRLEQLVPGASHGRRVLVVGDSMAGDFLLAVKAAKDRFAGYDFVRGSLSGLCINDFNRALRDITPSDPLCNNSDGFAAIKSGIVEADEVVLANAWNAETAETAFAIAEHIIANGKPAYVVDAFKVFNISDSSYYFARSGAPIEELGVFMHERLLPSYLETRQVMLDESGRNRAVGFIDKLEFFCKDRICRFYDMYAKPLLHDDMHVTAPGAAFYGEALYRAGYFSSSVDVSASGF